MTIMHIWVGLSRLSQADFYRYFEINPVEREAGRGASQFDKETGQLWYDDDWIGTYFDEQQDDLNTALDELPVSEELLTAVAARCAELGIVKANALFYYQDEDLTIPDPARPYNGLTYLGAFEDVD
jgi:hypothetical protein